MNASTAQRLLALDPNAGAPSVDRNANIWSTVGPSWSSGLYGKHSKLSAYFLKLTPE